MSALPLYYCDLDCVRTEPVCLEFGQFETFHKASDVTAALAQKGAELKQVQSAAISGMSAAHEGARLELALARRLHAESQPQLIDSERCANALLTQENEELTMTLAQRDAEILRLREALSFYAQPHHWCSVNNGDDDLAAVLLTAGEEHEHGWTRAQKALTASATTNGDE
jgi:hypothetical protein